MHTFIILIIITFKFVLGMETKSLKIVLSVCVCLSISNFLSIFSAKTLL